MAGVALYISATLPPRAVVLTAPIPPTVVFGGYHIHTTRSDGARTVDEVAQAAAKAGLKFVIITDHGDATRPPEPPAYRHGVLVIDAVEISTSSGHVVALGLEKPAPYPLAGRSHEVIEDIHRLGGWAVVAHPDSPKPELTWQAWDSNYDGVEWLNADSEWRDESTGRLIASALRATRRGPETVVSLFSRPNETLRRWSQSHESRAVVALGAMDAHGSWPLGLAAVLQSVWQGVELEQPLSGEAPEDARRVMNVLRRGRTFTIIPAIAAPAVLEFTATQSGLTLKPGDRLGLDAPVTFHASIPGAPDAQLELITNGGGSGPRSKGSLTHSGVPARGAYRVEVTFGDRESLPWILSNAIYAGEPTAASDSTPELLLERVAVPPSSGWAVEHAVESSGEVAAGEDGVVHFTFGLGPNIANNPYAAAVAEIAGSATLHAVEFTARADRPMRVSVQLRAPHSGFPNGMRWAQSIYVDETPRQFSLAVANFQPRDSSPELRSSSHEVRSLLFVVDTLNTTAGARGDVWISNVALGLRRPTF